MAKITKKSQIKARETKLNKKSKEELIAIVLKKDNTERNLNNQIKSLKGEINISDDINKNLKEDIKKVCKVSEQYKENTVELIDKLNKANKGIEYWRNAHDDVSDKFERLTYINSRNKYIATLLIILSIAIGFTVGVLC